MPEYQFSNPEDPNEIVSRFMSVHDKHEYVVGGVVWDRVWSVPQLASTTQIDPYNKSQFLDKTRTQGTYGDLLDRASDLAQKRAEKNDGVDPISKRDFNPPKGPQIYL